MKRILTVVLALFVGSPFATAGLELWSGNAGDVEITGDSAEITASGTFKFQSVTGGSLDVIDDITVADGVTGTVTVYIARDPNDNAGTDGATDVGSINLTNDQLANLIGNLAELRITGDLATANDVACRNITGTVTCVDVDNDITIETNLANGSNITASGDIGRCKQSRLGYRRRVVNGYGSHDLAERRRRQLRPPSGH